MKKFSIIHVPVLSFFSKALYADVGLSWKGTGFAYLALLLAACWIPKIVKIHWAASDFINNEAPAVVEQVPEITITNGEVSIEEPQPYYIREPEHDSVLAIIDTTGTIQSLEDANTICLLTRTHLIWRQSNVETRTFDLSKVENFVVDGNRIMGWLHTARHVIVPIVYPFAFLGSYVYRIVQALIYAAIGLLFASLCKVALPYPTLLRLAVVAVTPCIIVGTVLGLAGVHLPYAGLIYLLIALGYLFFGVKAVSETTTIQKEDEFPQQMGIWM